MDDADDEPIRRAIRRSFERYGQYQETVGPEDEGRVEQLRRLGDEVAGEAGSEASVAAVRRRDGLLQVCVLLLRPRS